MAVTYCISQLRDKGGFTMDLVGNKPTTGYMVALKGHEVTYLCDNMDMEKQIIREFVNSNQELLHVEGMYFGAWYNKENKRTYLDVSTNFQSKRKALEVARDNEQLAIWDVVNQVEIRL